MLLLWAIIGVACVILRIGVVVVMYCNMGGKLFIYSKQWNQLCHFFRIFWEPDWFGSVIFVLNIVAYEMQYMNVPNFFMTAIFTKVNSM
jgi:hypothetical protein